MMPILSSRRARRMSAALEHLDEVGGAAAQPRLPAGDLAHRLLERLLLAGDIAHGDVDRGQAGGARVGDDPVGQGAPALRRRLLVAVIGVGEPAERIDDDRHAFARTAAAAATAGSSGAGAGHAEEQCGGRRKRAHSSSGISSGLIGRNSDRS